MLSEKSSVQQNIMRPAKKQEYVTHTQGEKQDLRGPKCCTWWTKTLEQLSVRSEN